MGRLVMLARRARPGRAKTRLEPHLGRRRVVQLYRAFLRDGLAFLAELSGRHEVWVYWDGPTEPSAETLAVPAGVAEADQGRGDLGRRLLRVFERAAEAAAGATVVIGSDSPTLPADLVDDAFARLETNDVVVAPADDGGYVLLGLDRPIPGLFRDIPWSSPAVLRATRDRARELGLRLAELSPWFDVDDEAGLARLRAQLQQPEMRLRAPETTRVIEEQPSPAGS